MEKGGGAGGFWHQRAEARGAGKHLTVHRTAPGEELRTQVSVVLRCEFLHSVQVASGRSPGSRQETVFLLSHSRFSKFRLVHMINLNRKGKKKRREGGREDKATRFRSLW